MQDPGRRNGGGAGGPLALRRKAEVGKAHEILGIQGVVLDIHDGELEPTLENRRKLTRLIRYWNADIVMGHRPNDYHPDHRYTGVPAGLVDERQCPLRFPSGKVAGFS